MAVGDGDPCPLCGCRPLSFTYQYQILEGGVPDPEKLAAARVSVKAKTNPKKRRASRD